MNGKVTVITDKDVRPLFPPRKKDANKGTHGRACVVGGSKAFTGAPLLSANALCQTVAGAGYAYLSVPDFHYSLYATRIPDLIVRSFPTDGEKIKYDEDFLKSLLGFDAIAFGMGIGVGEGAYASARFLLANFKGRLILDADALNSFARYGVDALCEKKACDAVLTPHVLEFSRLTGKSVEEIRGDMAGAAEEFALKTGTTVLLKNDVSAISDGKKTVLNMAGSPAMAKAGSGDVLSGFLAGTAVRLSAFDAAVASAYCFGRAGEIAAKKYGEYSVYPSLLVPELGEAVKEVSQNGE